MAAPNSREFGVSRGRLIFFILTSVVPFLAYSAYYYYKMISKAPFRSKDLEYFELYYSNNKSGKTYSFDSSTQKFLLKSVGEAPVFKKAFFSQEDLSALHKVLIENIFFDMPDTLGVLTSHGTAYKLVVFYKTKSKEVQAFTPSHDRVYIRKLDAIQKYIELKLAERMEAPSVGVSTVNSK